MLYCCTVVYDFTVSVNHFISLFYREILLQAISVIIDIVGGKVKVTVIDELKQTLLTLLQTSQVRYVNSYSYCIML